VNVCSLPVEENVHVTEPLEGTQFDGSAGAAPASAAPHTPNTTSAHADTTSNHHHRAASSA
jgi:hypothetical protein